MSDNPYAAPSVLELTPPLDAGRSNAEAIREEHIKTEATIKTIGLLYWLGGLAIVAAAAMSVIASVTTSETGVHELLISVTLLALGVFQFLVGNGLRKFQRFARICAGVISALGLLAFPVGTLINVLILGTLFRKKSRMIFSEPYKEIIAATPHVKYKSSSLFRIVVYTFLVTLLLILVAGFIASRM